MNAKSPPEPIGHASNLRISGEPVGWQKVDVGKQKVAREIAALQQESRRYPALTSCPTGDRRRRKQLLPEGARRGVEVGNAGTVSSPSFRKVPTASSTGLLICVPTEAML